MTDSSPVKSSEPAASQLAARRLENFRKLRVVTTTIRTIVRMRNNVPKAIEDFDELYESLENSPSLPRPRTVRSTAVQAIDDHKATETLFQHIRIGTAADLSQIEQLIACSPKNYLRERSDAESIVNKPNAQGVRPLTEAVRNGHSHIVNFLLESGADPTLRSQVSHSEWETPLVTASRWNYASLAEHLLGATRWSDRDLYLAHKATRSQRIKEMLRTQRPRAFVWWKCFY